MGAQDIGEFDEKRAIKGQEFLLTMKIKILLQNYSNGDLEMLMRIRSCEDGKVGEVGKIENRKRD